MTVTGDPTTDAFITVLQWLIGPGAGVAVQAVMNWLIAELADDGHRPSPKTARRLTYLASIIVPSVCYGLLAVLTWQYNVTAHIMAILSAFGVATFIHGEKNLPTGAEQRVDALLAVPDAIAVPKEEGGAK